MPVCPNCMTNNPDGTAYCPHCGAAQSEKPAWQSQAVQPSQTPAPAPVQPTWQQPVAYEPAPEPRLPRTARILSIVSMVCGLSCLTFFCLNGISIPLGVAAIVLKVLAGKKTPYEVKNPMATVGLITGIVGLALCVLWIIGCFAGIWFNTVDSGYSDFYDDFYY